MENSSFERLPEDLQIQILSWLPVKSLVTWLCVSNKWASIIHGEYFKDLYWSRSKTRPRVMFMVERFTSQPHDPEMSWFQSVYHEQNFEPGAADTEVLFHSVYQEEKPLLSSGQQQLRIPFELVGSAISRPIGGLICLRLGTKVAICNPGTKTVRSNLPEIQADKKAFIRSFLGYDEVTKVFKVLCMAFNKPPKEYQVLTVGSGEEFSWRQITCELDHVPLTEGLCKGGVLYYVAHSYSDKTRVIMSFNVMSEDFSVIKLPEESKSTNDLDLVDYNGEIALANKTVDDDTGVLEMWVRDEKGEWSSNPIVIPRWEETVEDISFYFRGTIGTRELVFAQQGYYENESLYVLYYDTKTQNLRRIRVEELIEGPPLETDDYQSVKTFLDHVESTWLICEE